MHAFGRRFYPAWVAFNVYIVYQIQVERKKNKRNREGKPVWSDFFPEMRKTSHVFGSVESPIN